MAAPPIPQATFWNGKRVLLTGHTGFKGAWLAIWLHRLGAQVTGVALAPSTQPSLFDRASVDGLLDSRLIDVRDAAAVSAIVADTRPDVVLHLAAQALVRRSYREPLETFATNVMGTAHVLDALRQGTGTRVAVMVTTDKVYANAEQIFPYREVDALGGHDPYSASKAASEIVIASYREALLAPHAIALASARAGNVIGGGDWSEDRLIPDAIRAWDANQALQVRRPASTRPWQHVLEPLAGYLVLAEKLWSDADKAGAYNLGPLPHEAATVREVIEIARAAYGQGDVSWGNGDDGPHEAKWLALETAKARQVLQFRPRWSLNVTVNQTVKWYRRHADGASARALCLADIDAYEAEQT